MILSTENIIANTTSLKPNPANDFTIINWENEAVQSIEIYNMIGSLVHQENVENYETEKQINLSNLENGMYLVRLNTEKGAMITKLMIMD
jgi:hypothetical protein